MGCHVFQVSLFLFLCILNLSFNLLEAQMVPAVFVFGDSLVDVGNNNHLKSIFKANFPYNGIDFPTKKPTGRFTNGKNAADLLAEKVGLPTPPPYIPLVSDSNASFVAGVSFASGGAGIFNGTVNEDHPTTFPLTQQAEFFSTVSTQLERRLGSSSAQSLLSKSLYVFVIGSNDIFGYSGDSKKQNTPQQYADLMALGLKGQLQRIYSSGARKFAIAGIAPVGCCPSQRVKNKTEECNEETNNLVVMYNAGLKSLLQGLKSELKDISYSYFDTYGVFMNLIQNSTAYGFTEVKAACCGVGKLKANLPCIPVLGLGYCSNRSDHVFWDLFHPTQAVHGIIADTMFDNPSQYTFPMTVKQLIAVN